MAVAAIGHLGDRRLGARAGYFSLDCWLEITKVCAKGGAMMRLGMGSRLRQRPWSVGRRSIRRSSVIAVGLLLISSVAFAAQAGPAKKQFGATVAPGIVNQTGAVTFTATVQNLNMSQTLGSAQFTVPTITTSGFALTIEDHSVAGATDPQSVYNNGQAFTYPCDQLPSASTTPCAEILNGGRTIEFDNLSLPSGATFTGTFSVNAPSACVDRLPWSVLAHQANNFSGSPGNFYAGPASPGTTTVVTACSLNWTVQPTDALPSTTIAGDPGTPASANLITVTVQDGSGTTIVGANIPISLTLVDLHGTLATLSGAGPVTASGGVAHFAAPQIDLVGNYQLQATSAGVSCSQNPSSCGLSRVFSIDSDIASCTKNISCATKFAQGDNGTGSTQAPNPPANGGHVTVAFGIWKDLVCPGYTPINQSVTFEYLPPANGVLTAINGTFTLPHSSTTQVCFASIASFNNTKKGFAVTSVVFDGQTYTVGVIDVCSKSNAAPCYNKSTGAQIDTFTIVGRSVDDMVGRG
jgi:hypothetical protein